MSIYIYMYISISRNVVTSVWAASQGRPSRPEIELPWQPKPWSASEDLLLPLEGGPPTLHLVGSAALLCLLGF